MSTYYTPAPIVRIAKGLVDDVTIIDPSMPTPLQIESSEDVGGFDAVLSNPPFG